RPLPPKNARAAQGVVPRRLEVRRKQHEIRILQKLSVQVGFELAPMGLAFLLIDAYRYLYI
ncbi:MAG: hypothetical protein WBS22_03635, partial [Methylocystis sp.]